MNVDGQPRAASLQWLDRERAVLVEVGPPGTRQRVLLLPRHRAPGPHRGVVRREIVVDGWRIEVDVEPAGRAELRERAERGRTGSGESGPIEVRAMIPGVVVAVAVGLGDPVSVGQPLVVVEAMKMENEVRSTRSGTVARVAVCAGETVELGDVLVVISPSGMEGA